MSNNTLIQRATFMKQTLLTAAVVLTVTGSGFSFSQEETLSPAELAAMAANPRDRTQDMIMLCQNALLHISDTKKEKLVDKLDGKTCREAVELHLSNTNYPSE